ncbi:MAG: porin family protein [Burkholderiaceae bacterium]
MVKQTTFKAALVSTAFALAGIAAPVFADPQVYVGGSIGAKSDFKLNCVPGAPCDKSDGTSGKLYGGMMFNDVPFGVEAVYYQTGSAKAGIQDGSVLRQGTAKNSGLGVTGVAQATFGDFALKGRLGVGYSRGKVSYAAGGSASESSFQPILGVGASYAITKHWAVNADWDRYPTKFNKTEKANTDLFSVGVSYKF